MFNFFTKSNILKLSVGAVSLMSSYIAKKQKSFSLATTPSQASKIQQEKQADLLHNVCLFTGNANIPLAKEIADELNLKLSSMTVSKFSDGEVNIRVQDNVRGKDVFVIQPTCTPVNEHLVELLLIISTMRRASARKINVIIPYYGYARQDRKMAARVPISAADVAKLLETMGVDRVICIDLHCGQIQGFFPPRVPVDNLEGSIIGLKYFMQQKSYLYDNLCIVSPDAGGVASKKFKEMLQQTDQKINPNLAMIIKYRNQPGQIAMMHVVGDVVNKNVIIIDDMIDTAGTLCYAANELKNRGAKNVIAFATHGVFSGAVFDHIKKSSIKQIVVTNTIPQKAGEDKVSKIKRLTIAPLLAETIKRIQQKQSESSLFNINQK